MAEIQVGELERPPFISQVEARELGDASTSLKVTQLFGDSLGLGHQGSCLSALGSYTTYHTAEEQEQHLCRDCGTPGGQSSPPEVISQPQRACCQGHYLVYL